MGGDPRVHRALADESRLRILRVLRDSDTALDTRQIAEFVGLHPTTVRTHLELLSEVGLVTAQPEVRTEPGRPRILYEPAPAAVAPDTYRVLAQILANQLASDTPNSVEQALRAGQEWGAQLVASSNSKPNSNSGSGNSNPGHSGSNPDASGNANAQSGSDANSNSKPPSDQSLDAIIRVFARLGFACEYDSGNGDHVTLRDCPYRDIARGNPSVICAVHLGVLRGALEALLSPVTVDHVEPFVDDETCLAHLIPAMLDEIAPEEV